MIQKSILISLGNLFFRYRSYIPIPIIFLAFYFYYISPINKINPSIFNYCLSISLTGLLIRVLVVGYSFDKTSGRNTKSQLASKINKTGIYSLIRHPLYIGNFLIWLGASLITNNLYFVLFSYKKYINLLDKENYKVIVCGNKVVFRSLDTNTHLTVAVAITDED